MSNKYMSKYQVITKEDCNKLMEATDELRWKALISALWLTGHRVSEVISIDKSMLTIISTNIQSKKSIQKS